MNKISVKINGMEYILKGEEEEQYLQKIAEYVDRKIRNLMDINPKLDVSAASVLTAINMTDEIMKGRNSFKEMEKLKNELLATENSLQEKISVLEKELKNTEQINRELKLQNQSAKSKIIDLQKKLIDSQIDVAKSKKYEDNRSGRK